MSPSSQAYRDHTAAMPNDQDTVDVQEIAVARKTFTRCQPILLTLQHGAVKPAADKQKVYQFAQPRVHIGRALDNDVMISTPLRKVSRYHAEIYMLGDRYWLCDLESKCGTLINGEVVCKEKPRLLSTGDVVQVGDFLLHFAYV